MRHVLSRARVRMIRLDTWPTRIQRRRKMFDNLFAKPMNNLRRAAALPGYLIVLIRSTAPPPRDEGARNKNSGVATRYIFLQEIGSRIIAAASLATARPGHEPGGSKVTYARGKLIESKLRLCSAQASSVSKNERTTVSSMPESSSMHRRRIPSPRISAAANIARRRR